MKQVILFLFLSISFLNFGQILTNEPILLITNKEGFGKVAFTHNQNIYQSVSLNIINESYSKSRFTFTDLSYLTENNLYLIHNKFKDLNLKVIITFQLTKNSHLVMYSEFQNQIEKLFLKENEIIIYDKDGIPFLTFTKLSEE